MSIFTGISTETLQARLAAAQTAHDALSTGQSVVSVRMGDKQVSYYGGDPKSVERLERYIRQLQSALGLTGPRVTGIYLAGGKGL